MLLQEYADIRLEYLVKLYVAWLTRLSMLTEDEWWSKGHRLLSIAHQDHLHSLDVLVKTKVCTGK